MSLVVGLEEAKRIAKQTIQAIPNANVYLQGHKGVGKTTLAYQVMEELNLIPIVFDLGDESSIKGLRDILLPSGEEIKCPINGSEGVIFDETGRLPTDLNNPLHFFLSPIVNGRGSHRFVKGLGGHLREVNCPVIATSNIVGEGLSPLDVAFLDRMTITMVIQPTVDEKIEIVQRSTGLEKYLVMLVCLYVKKAEEALHQTDSLRTSISICNLIKAGLNAKTAFRGVFTKLVGIGDIKAIDRIGTAIAPIAEEFEKVYQAKFGESKEQLKEVVLLQIPLTNHQNYGNFLVNMRKEYGLGVVKRIAFRGKDIEEWVKGSNKFLLNRRDRKLSIFEIK